MSSTDRSRRGVATPVPAAKALDTYFLEARAKLLDYQQHSHKQTVPIYWTQQDAVAHTVRTVCHLVLTLPEFQLD